MPILENKFFVKKIGIFGSFARNTQTPASDVDILVEFSRPVGLRFVTLQQYLEQLLGRQVDLVTPAALKSQLKNDILREVIYT